MGRASWKSILGFSLAFLAGIEMATRIDQAIRFGASPFGSYTYDSVLFDHDEYGPRGRPHARYEKWSLNGLGLRGPEAPPPSSATRVVAMGASETFGLYESEGNEWPRVLERELAARGGRYVVLNGALPGMSPLMQLRHLRYRLLELEPDVLIWMVHYTAFAGLDSEGIRSALEMRSPVPPPPGWLAALRPRALQKAREVLLPRLPWSIPEKIERLRSELRLTRIRESMGSKFGSMDQVSEGEQKAFEGFVTSLVQSASQVGSRVVIVFPPRLVDDRTMLLHSTTYPYVTRHWLDEAFELFPTLAARQASSVVSIADLRNVIHEGESGLMLDMVHYSDAGAARIAAGLVDCVAANRCATNPAGKLQLRSDSGAIRAE